MFNVINKHPKNNPNKKKLKASAQIGIYNLLSKGQKDINVTFEFDIVKIQSVIIRGIVSKKDKTLWTVFMFYLIFIRSFNFFPILKYGISFEFT